MVEGVEVEVGAVEEEGEEVELVAVEQPVLVVQEHLEEELAVEQGQEVWWPPQPPQGQEQQEPAQPQPRGPEAG